jgi:pimeloyl-ACP methyl ester carboxylesterase
LPRQNSYTGGRRRLEQWLWARNVSIHHKHLSKSIIGWLPSEEACPTDEEFRPGKNNLRLSRDDEPLIHTLSIITQRGSTLSIKAAGQGPAVMLVHGFPLDHRMWLKQIAQLSERYHVIVPELRGFGGSSLDEQYTLGDLADDLELVRRHLADNQRLHLVGMSMGGYVALEYWSRYADRLASLTLANTKPGVDDPAGKKGRLEMAEKVLQEGTWPAISVMIPRLLPTSALGTPVEQQVVEMMQSAKPPSVAAAQRAMAQRRDFTNLLPSIDVPTFVLTGNQDVIAPPQATAVWASQIPRSQFAELSGIGHMSPMEAPDRFNSLLLSWFGSELNSRALGGR